MIPYDLDPSLHSGEPESAVLDDGFSPKPHNDASHETSPQMSPRVTQVDPALWAKSAF